jgi:cobalt-zinc-cadmium resistance protein CzcA
VRGTNATLRSNTAFAGVIWEAVWNRRCDVNQKVKLPRGYKLDWAGEYESQKRANKRLSVIVPITVLMIALLLYSAFGAFKWAGLVMVNILLAPVGGLYALYLTGTHFSVSSGVGFLALFGVSVQTGVIMVEYINQLRGGGKSVEDAAVDGAVLRLRPIMMWLHSGCFLPHCHTESGQIHKGRSPL